jgi:acetylornithine deacetylase/succinyl-diaminopimelate desuccinylase-like protein
MRSQAFSRIAMALYAQVGGHDDIVKFTIGRMVVEPNAPSVVPERVSLRIDLRHPDNAVLELLGERLVTLCETLAAPCHVTRDAAGRRAFQRASTPRCSKPLRRPPSASASRTCPFFRPPATTRATWRRCARAR